MDVMVDSMREIATTSYWDEWGLVRAPTLVVRAGKGVRREDVLRMKSANPHARLIEIVDAMHDVHLDKPREWRKAVDPFLSQPQKP
jgi:pimeloyl-ACP methyl ester carboxylesterase